MLFRWNAREYLALFSYVVKWFFLVAPVAAAIGSACALFLWALERHEYTPGAAGAFVFVAARGRGYQRVIQPLREYCRRRQ